MRFNRGHYYEGARQGFGTLTVATCGLHYAGEWTHGCFHGEGKWSRRLRSPQPSAGAATAWHHAPASAPAVQRHSLAVETYEGSFIGGLRSGFGVQRRGGERYEGEWQMGRRAGIGRLLRTDGSIFCGEFVDGKEGEGAEVAPSAPSTPNPDAPTPHEARTSVVDAARLRGG